MPTLSIGQVHQLARGAGLNHEQAIIATAIAMGESGLRTDAVGDVSLQDSTWGPSVGLWQIRSYKSWYGSGLARDAARLKDPKFNAKSMHMISMAGSNWGPWSVYTNGSYKTHLGAVRAAVGNGSSLTAPAPSGGGNGSGGGSTVPTSGDWDPLPGGDGLPGYGDDLLGGLNIPGLPSGDDIEKTLIVGLMWSAAFGLAVTLIAVGAWRAVQ